MARSASLSLIEPNAIISEQDGGLGWDVRVPLSEEHYDALTLKRMVKVINRRGRVRWFAHDEWETRDGVTERSWSFYKSPSEKIAGLDEHIEFIHEALSSDHVLGLYLSFEDRFEARRFASDLAALRNVQAKEPSKRQIKASQADRAKREALQEKHRIPAYPPAPVLRVTKHSVSSVGTWCVMVGATGLIAADVDRWMRSNIVSKYWAATWKPGEAPRYLQASYRYYRLSVATWQRLIDRCRSDDAKLIVALYLHEDLASFDRRFGPASFLRER